MQADEAYKHPLGKKIGYTENKFASGDEEIPYVIEAKTPKRVGIAYEQKLHLPKLPHSMPLSPEQKNVEQVILKLKISPPESIKVKKILVHNGDDQEIEVDAEYGKAVTKETLKVDDTTLGDQGENDEAITVILERKNEEAGEEPNVFSEDIRQGGHLGETFGGDYQEDPL